MSPWCRMRRPFPESNIRVPPVSFTAPTALRPMGSTTHPRTNGLTWVRVPQKLVRSLVHPIDLLKSSTTSTHSSTPPQRALRVRAVQCYSGSCFLTKMYRTSRSCRQPLQRDLQTGKGIPIHIRERLHRSWGASRSFSRCCCHW